MTGSGAVVEWCNDWKIASGTVPDPGSLKGNDTTMLDVGLKVPHSVLFSLAKEIGVELGY